MPYIVITKRPNPVPEIALFVVTSRRAVATLKEARQYCEDEVERICGHLNDPNDDQHFGPEWDEVVIAAQELPESGGTVGPLPDGTTIRVEPMPWDQLSAYVEVPLTTMAGGGCSRIIDAYNTIWADQ